MSSVQVDQHQFGFEAGVYSDVGYQTGAGPTLPVMGRWGSRGAFDRIQCGLLLDTYLTIKLINLVV